MSEDAFVRYNVRMPERLRDDAKRNSERGELAEHTRELFRRKAYGVEGSKENTELQQAKAELRDVRSALDDLRRDRRQIDAEIETYETRAARLEERVSSLEEEDDKFSTVVDTLENLLLDGTRIFSQRVDDDVDASAVIEELRDRNPEVPDHAFELAEPYEPNDWKEVQ